MTKRRLFFQYEANIGLQKAYIKGIFSFPSSVTYQDPVREDKKIMTKGRLFFQNEANFGLQNGYTKGIFLFPHSVPYQHPISEDEIFLTKRRLFFQYEANVGLQNGYIKGTFHSCVQFHISTPWEKTLFFDKKTSFLPK